MTDRIHGSSIGTIGQHRESDSVKQPESGEFGGRKVTAGGVLNTIGRVLLGVVTLGISELVIHLASRKAQTASPPMDGARAKDVLSTPSSDTQRLAGRASQEFGAAVAGSINDKFGPGGDLDNDRKFTDGVHDQFRADSNRATYRLNGHELPKTKGAVVDAFKDEFSEEELRAVTGVLHQGASLSLIEQLMFSEVGFVKGQLGGAPSITDKEGTWATNEEGIPLRDEEGRKIPAKSSTYSIERGEGGVLKVTIEDRTQMQSSGLYDEEGRPQLTYLDPAKSSLHTKITGEIRPGEDPLFRITQPIEYDLRMTPR